MTSIITNRKFIIKSPDEIVSETMKKILEENEVFNSPEKFEIKKDELKNYIIENRQEIKEKSVYVKPIEQPKNKKFFIPKFYI